MLHALSSFKPVREQSPVKVLCRKRKGEEGGEEGEGRGGEEREGEGREGERRGEEERGEEGRTTGATTPNSNQGLPWR